MTSALLLILKNSALQFFGLFGVLFLSGMLLTWISRWTNNTFRQFVLPKFGLYVFGVIGVPLHELCHALFAKIFFHEIGSIKWFDPEGKGGSYGVVVHHYNDRNLYHRIGLFFIGMGPVLLAPVLLFALYSFLVPHPVPFSLHLGDLGFLANDFSKSLLGAANWSSMGFYAFLYLAVCLTSQMELSSEDLKVARGGVLPILLLILLVNTAAGLFNFNLHARFVNIFNMGLVWWGAFLAVAVFISLLNLLFCAVLFNVLNKIFGRQGINPFQS
ncbi:MAG: hypothetical protein JSU04_07910 [Bdellovibrionales bacterium]|nr:hypothetical protein [Bdellovibrionales bacterium]